MSNNNQPVQSMNEALGYRDSALLSTLAGETIILASAEFEQRKDEEQKEYENVYLTTQDGGVYRSSNSAVLNKAHKLAENETFPVRCRVVWRKSNKKGAKPYLDLVDADTTIENEVKAQAAK